ncbi:MAG: DUF58 domain-containing protein [Candidatus Brocadiia bacterium]
MARQRMESQFLEMGVLSLLSHLRFGTQQVVEGAYAGRHRSHHAGGASEFREHRQYSPGDDVRRLDWKVLGRTGRSYVKVFEEETNLVATLVLDVSRSMLFGAESERDTTGSKLDYARYLCAALAHIITREQDRCGLALAATSLEEYIPSRTGSAHMEAVLSTLEGASPVPETELATPLRDLFARLTERGCLIILSDFLEEDLDRLFSAIRLFRHRNFDVLLLHILHPLERRLPRGPAYRFVDLEGEGVRLCSPNEVADLYERRFRRFLDGIRSVALAAGCRYHLFSTSVPYVQNLKTLLVDKRG